MTPEQCSELALLIQADIDGELPAAEAANVAKHVEACPSCATLQQDLLELSGRIREIRSPTAPPALKAAIAERLGAPAPRRPAAGRRAWFAGGLSLGVALAASLLVFAWLPKADMAPDVVVAAHIRALQPSHLMDVVSTDQHTVKPWFAGRLPFSPPVKDLTAQDFKLVGGRLDYLPGQTAATLIYQRRQHLIDLFVWPTPPTPDKAPANGSREGYNFFRWQAGGMTFWAVSDLNSQELAQFANAWR
ncbi:Transmembrane transcriptional regulator (anti-sigma factor RsiW) [Arboricoccus pini]|uniref:Transmembrane transcriptional regulator (Anti-sigma factor RsiW) n=1 Tax=Arboricoccus pini TaxID=1963835 RepID=A0A212RL46_9PROT|nr:anti-sigma factor [Arboricoccus pini]SNB73190.1 Transmembrane transcriptional regulator (anti-sigma factor RsiW) [Arboricoccus pini]